jgi:hypothetical protein
MIGGAEGAARLAIRGEPEDAAASLGSPERDR